jgi:hypothetical protein
MRQRLLLFALALSTCTACTRPLQGPAADLHAIATPDPVAQSSRALPQPLPGPTPEQGSFRAWVPPQTSANGDQVQGHWLVISNTPPALETTEPAKPMPRAPKTHFGAKSPAQAPPQMPAQPQPVPPATPTPVLPTGLLRGSQAAPQRSILGGQ